MRWQEVEGPWQKEPNKIEWAEEASGYACKILRHMTSGHLNGYVGVPRSHSLYGLPYSAKALCSVRVHGGLTFSDKMPSDLRWWFGFDAAHSGDLTPLTLHPSLISGADLSGVYRDVAFMYAETESLARQLKKIRI